MKKSTLVIGKSLKPDNPTNVFRFQLLFGYTDNRLVYHVFTLEDATKFNDLLNELFEYQEKARKDNKSLRSVLFDEYDFFDRLAASPMKRLNPEFDFMLWDDTLISYFDESGVEFEVDVKWED